MPRLPLVSVQPPAAPPMLGGASRYYKGQSGGTGAWTTGGACGFLRRIILATPKIGVNTMSGTGVKRLKGCFEAVCVYAACLCKRIESVAAHKRLTGASGLSAVKGICVNADLVANRVCRQVFHLRGSAPSSRRTNDRPIES